MEEMLTHHLDLLARCMAQVQNQAEKLEVARVLRVLAKHNEVCRAILERHLAMISELARDSMTVLQARLHAISSRPSYFTTIRNVLWNFSTRNDPFL